MTTKVKTFHRKGGDQIVIPINPTLKERIEHMAETEQVSRAEIARRAITHYLDMHAQ